MSWPGQGEAKIILMSRAMQGRQIKAGGIELIDVDNITTIHLMNKSRYMA